MARNTAIVLSGGGAYAAYEVGVMKALFTGHSPATGHQPLDPEFLVGTSAGAMNAAALASRDSNGLIPAVEKLEYLWLNRIAEDTPRCGNGVYRIRGLPVDFLNIQCYRENPLRLFTNVVEDATLAAKSFGRIATNPSRLADPLAQFNLAAFVDTDPFSSSLKEYIPIDGILKSKRKLRIVAMSLNTGKIRVFTKRDVERYGHEPLRASTALPAFFPPRKIAGEEYIDGSTLMNTPLLPAIAEAEELHVIYMDPQLEAIERRRLDNTVDVLDRTLVVHFANAINRDVELARSINEALALIASRCTKAEQLDDGQMHSFLRMAARIYERIEAGRPYRPLTIHRYRPRDDLGETLGLMNIGFDKLKRVIARGYQDAIEHDCALCGCVVAPAAAVEAARAAPPLPVEPVAPRRVFRTPTPQPSR